MYVDTETDFDFDGDSDIVDFYDIIRGRKSEPTRKSKTVAADETWQQQIVVREAGD